MQQVLKRQQKNQLMEELLKSHNVKEGLSRPESRTGATGSELQSVIFWLIKGKKSCPATGLEAGVQSTEFPMTEVDKHELDGLTVSRWQ